MKIILFILKKKVTFKKLLHLKERRQYEKLKNHRVRNLNKKQKILFADCERSASRYLSSFTTKFLT